MASCFETQLLTPHPVVEQYRLLEQMINIIKVPDERTGKPSCNPGTPNPCSPLFSHPFSHPTNPPPEVCPTMSASGHTYTWLDNNKKPIKIPAIQYIALVQKWISGKITDPSIFPTDTSSFSPATSSSTAAAYPSGTLTPSNSAAPQPLGPTSLSTPLNQLAGRDWLGKSSGFPETFETDIKSIYRQMMRCYAHIYHGHWLEPFWHAGAYKELNTCFVHFINVGKLFGLITDKEIEPMQPLVDIWLGKGLLPPAGAAGAAPASGSSAERPQEQAPAGTAV